VTTVVVSVLAWVVLVVLSVAASVDVCVVISVVSVVDSVDVCVVISVVSVVQHKGSRSKVLQHRKLLPLKQTQVKV
jgi:hypothetical protein